MRRKGRERAGQVAGMRAVLQAREQIYKSLTPISEKINEDQCHTDTMILRFLLVL